MPSKPTKKASAKKSDYEKFKAKHPKELAKAQAELAAAEKKAAKKKARALTNQANTVEFELPISSPNLEVSFFKVSAEPEVIAAIEAPAPPTHIPAPGIPSVPPTVKAR